MGLLTTLLTITCILVTFLVAFYRLWKNPPVIVISFAGLTIPPIPSDMTIRLNQTTQVVPADVELKPKDEPIPEDILDYISQESEVHAQDARKRRVRMLKLETGSWLAAFRLLQKEDNPLD